MASLMRAFNANGAFETLLVHTGQHYDDKMSHLFFEELNIPRPGINLEVGSGSHAVQTAEIMKRFEPVVLRYKPGYVLVVGDVNSTIACGLVAVKLGVKLIHVEAGLRSFDRTMPEEINRIVTDSISDLLFVTEQSGLDNLKNEGIDSDKIHLVGNVMIDTLLANREKSEGSAILEQLHLEKKKYAVVTLHRPSNVDSPDRFEKILAALEIMQKDIKLVFPIHPRTKNNLDGTYLHDYMKKMHNLILLEPVGYLDFLKLMSHTALVITDSGGIQEETTILGVPCMTLRENTERPVTIEEGTNQLVKSDTENILSAYRELKAKDFNVSGRIPRFWDGRAAERIVEIIIKSG
jgi:UDP-N-acetylglucosamine 2-epimerase (non-hydrolysing)